MSIARRAGWLIGRALRCGVRDEWGGFRRGLQTGLAGMALAAGGAMWLASNTLNDREPPPARRPAPAPNFGTHRLAGRLDENHQCTVRATVAGVPMTMLVDTGASIISFNRDHARRLGVDPARLVYDVPTHTANGIGRAASVILSELRLGDLVLRDVPAMIDYAGADYPLLGGPVFNHVQLDIGRGACALRW